MMKTKNNTSQNPAGGIEGRLDALVILMVELLREMAKNPKSGQIAKAEDKVAMALIVAGIPQTETAKLVGIDVQRVNRLAKKLKGK